MPLSLILGLAAALAWGIHDVSVRRVTREGALLAPLFWVLAAGTALVVAALPAAGGGVPEGRALGAALAAGAAFGLCGCALYRAFSIGPVRLVAPVIGAYPILSVLIAALQGAPVSAPQWLAVLAVVAGVGLVAGGGRGEAPDAAGLRALPWAAAAGAGYAASFALGQEASQGAGDLGALAVTRLAACAVVGALALALRLPLRPARGTAALITLMGACDALALGAVMAAGPLPRPEFASVAASMFGLVTIVLAWLLLGERMRPRQWIGVGAAFGAIGWLSL